MKKVSLVFGIGLAIIGLSAFTAEKSSEKEAAKDKSIIEWTGSKVFGGSHNGTIQVKENNLVFTDGKLMKGSVTVDMTTIKNLDLEGSSNDKLVNHLNSDDFFGVKNFPTAKIEITRVAKEVGNNIYQVTANLTIKGITHSQNFNVTIDPKETYYLIKADLDVDRSKYNVRYGSTSFFDDLGDKAISDNFNLKVTLVSPK